jgi:hypothetical protein
MMNDTDMEKCTGLMEVCIRGNGLKEFNMVMEKCISLMVLRKLVYLKTMYLREDKTIPSKNLLLFDLLLNQVPRNKL